MAALVKYVDSDNTKDPDSDEEKPEKGLSLCTAVLLSLLRFVLL